MLILLISCFVVFKCMLFKGGHTYKKKNVLFFIVEFKWKLKLT